MKICPYCGIKVAPEFENCPNCGKDIRSVQNIFSRPKDKIDTKHKSFADKQAEKEARSQINKPSVQPESNQPKIQISLPTFNKPVNQAAKDQIAQFNSLSDAEKEKAKQALMAKQKKASVIVTVAFFVIFTLIVLLTVFFGH